jgi:membrane-bound lytic murein transglycosylase D
MEEALKTDTSAVAITVETDSTDKFPITVNGRVAAAMKYFQTKGRRIFTRWLERSGRYKELYQQILREEGVPEELFYLAMIESGFVNHAYSYARAAGPWQFMAGTGGMYGLRHSWWFDERRDPIKSTRAAAKHLNYLYDMFDDWLLAIAGYNVSPRKVMRRCQIQKTRDFWKLRKLPRQTLNYVPTYTAAVIMAREPEKYGFFPEYYPPLQIDTVIVHEAIDLSLIAQWTDTTYKAIKELNPAVLRWCTPPGVKNFSVNIPRGKKEAFYKGLKSIPESEKLSYIRYRIREGDVLGNIARKFGVSVSVIKKQNHLRGSRIYAGKYLIIPVPKNRSAYYASYRKKSKTYKKKNYAPKSIPGRKKVIYVVKSGDTVGQIAEDYHIRASEIRRWNGISRRSIIHPGQKLTIFTPDADAVSLSAITKKVNNDFSLKPGELVYTVKSGDTLWKIAQEYNTSIKKLKQRNQIGNTIKPGEKLIITQ